MAGYNKFVDMLKKKGFPAQSPGVFNFDKKAALESCCRKAEEIGDTIAIHLTETVFEDITSELWEKVAACFEESVDSDVRAELGRGFLFHPYHASEKYDR